MHTIWKHLIITLIMVNMLCSVESKWRRKSKNRGKSGGWFSKSKSSASNNGGDGWFSKSSKASSNSNIIPATESSFITKHNINSGRNYFTNKNIYSNNQNNFNNYVTKKPSHQIKTHLAAALAGAYVSHKLNKFSNKYNERKEYRTYLRNNGYLSDNYYDNNPDYGMNDNQYDYEITNNPYEIESTLNSYNNDQLDYIHSKFERDPIIPFHDKPKSIYDIYHDPVTSEIHQTVGKYDHRDPSFREIAKHGAVYKYLFENLGPKDTEVMNIPSDSVLSNYEKPSELGVLNWKQSLQPPGPEVYPLVKEHISDELITVESSGIKIQINVHFITCLVIVITSLIN